MNHIDLLKRCHQLIRGEGIRTPTGLTTQDADRLAAEIAVYLTQISPSQIAHSNAIDVQTPEVHMGSGS